MLVVLRPDASPIIFQLGSSTLFWGLDSPFLRETNYVIGSTAIGSSRALFKQSLSATSQAAATNLQTTTRVITKGTANQLWIEVPGRWKPWTRVVIAVDVTKRRSQVLASATATASIKMDTQRLGLSARATATVSLSVTHQSPGTQSLSVNPLPVPVPAITKRINKIIPVT